MATAVRDLTEADIAGLLQGLAAQAFCHAAIPASARDQLVRLQAPLLRLAGADTVLLRDAAHPLRRLLQAMMGMALGCDQPGPGGDAHYRMLEGLIGQTAGLAPGDASSCEGLLAEAEAFFAGEEEKIRDVLQRMIGDAVRDETRSRAQTVLENEIAARLEDGDVADFVEEFLRTRWLQVLEFGAGVRETRPEVLPALLETMDELVWSVKPKAGAGERKELLGRLPSLLPTLNAWLDVIGWHGVERGAFFASLAECHAAIIRPPAGMTPRDHLEMRMNAVQKASEHQLTRRADEDRKAALAAFAPQVDSMAPGSWVALVRNHGGTVNCRLLWISPGGSRFIFVAASMRRLFVLSKEMLAQALQAERAGVIVPDIMIGKALEAATGESGVA